MSDDDATANNESRPAVVAPVQPSVRPLLERLRAFGNEGFPVALEAADEIERLQAATRRQIDYERLIDDCFETTRQRQGSLGCRQFARGAEWWREQVLKA
jgi:hypothetical protein